MKQRSKSLPVLVLVAVVALVLGSIGTAVAGPALTKSQVKKIAKKQAKKVVNQMAPTLSVASAANAGNATNLNGKPASAYLTQTYLYQLPATTPATNRNYTFPGLPAGTYVVNYAGFFTSATGQAVGCQIIRDTGGTDFMAVSYGARSLFANQVSAVGSGQFTTSAVSGPILNCFSQAGENFTVNNTLSVRSQVTFTRVDATTSSTATREAIASSSQGVGAGAH
jgi:hypothetical protein